MTTSRVVKSLLAPAAPVLALLAAGVVLARFLDLPEPGPAAGLLVALVALRVGVTASVVRGADGGDGRTAAERPSRRAALHAAHV